MPQNEETRPTMTNSLLKSPTNSFFLVSTDTTG